MRRLLSLVLMTMALSAFGEKGYLFSYFSGRPSGGRRGEAAGLHLAWSLDGLSWTALNDDEPMLVPEVGTDKLMRDPSICQGPDGTFHLVWTSGWKDRCIGYAHSTDLIHWSDQRLLPVMEHEQTARNCWAPEVTYNPEDGLFYLYWSTTIPGRHTPIRDMSRREAGLNHRIYLTTTRDFKTFAETKLWYNPDYSVIDASFVKDEASREWLCFVKNENHTPVQKNIRLLRAPTLEGLSKAESSGPLTEHFTEGPSPLFVGDMLYLYFDYYRDAHFGALRSRDHGTTWEDVSAELRLPKGVRHGTAFAVDRDVLTALLVWDRQRKVKSGIAEGSDLVAEANDISLQEIKMSAEKLVYFGQRVRISGEVDDVVRFADSVQLAVSDYHGKAVVVLPLADAEPLPRGWEKGARVRATGLLTYRFEDGRDARLTVDRESDVEILRPAPQPPWWTPLRVAIGAGSLTLLRLIALGWALWLRRQRAAEARINEAVQKERLRLSHDLHDGYQQLLAGCMFRLTAAQTLMRKGNVPKAETQLEGLQSSLTHAQDELRAALWTMKEEAEGPSAMAELFRYAAARLPQWEGKVAFETEGEEKPMSRRHAGALLMILQEAVGNALRHGQAEHVRVKTVFGRRGFAVIIKDDGCGFDPSQPVAGGSGVHLGLESMRSRVAKIGGRFSVQSVPGAGTEVKIVLEVEP